MKKPFFSVVIPTYNQAKFLKIALRSVFSQTFKNFEIIVIDNYSNDKTHELLKKYKKKIILKKIRNRGVIAKSRNLGIKLARGEWISFLDSDDYWSKNKLSEVYKIINEKTCDSICHSEWISNKEKKNYRVWSYGPYTNNFYKTLLKFGGRVSTSATTVKKSFIIKNNILYDENYKFITAEDYYFFMKIAKKKGVFIFINKPLGHHLFHEKSASSTYSKHHKAIEEVIKYHILKVQKFEKDKKKLWNEINSFYSLKEKLFGFKKTEFSNQKKVNLFSLFFQYPFNVMNFLFYILIKRTKEIIIYSFFKTKN